jgi:hypothetical protein
MTFTMTMMPGLARFSLKRMGAIAALTGGLLLPGCAGGIDPMDETPDSMVVNRGNENVPGSLFGGEDGIDLFDGLFGSKKGGGGGGGNGIGVNTYLWRAALDTVSFMPLTSADPFGGVIITDWYTPPEAPSERFKIIVYILDRQLRADGIRVSVFRQKQSAKGWTDANVTKKTAVNFENEILDQARQLRFAARTDIDD